MDFLKIFLLFWFCSFLGWVVEVIAFIYSDKKIINRGFLIGPYCPIYGSGAMIMLLISPYKNHLFVCFILALVLCSTLEYIASYIMERLFEIRWWDYSDDAFNINGRICLRNAIAFGALGVIFTRFIYPLYSKLISYLSNQAIIIISIIVFILTIIDIFVSFNAMSKIKTILGKEIENYKNKDATDDVNKLVNKKLPGINFLQKRLIDTYHLLDKEKKYIMKTIKKVNEKTKSGYGLFFIFIIIGLVIGLILSLYFKLGSPKIIIPFSLSVASLITAIILKVGDK